MNGCFHRLSVVVLFGGAWLCCGAETKDKSGLKISKEEQMIVDLTNEARKKEKLQPLKPNPVLFEVARAHSANMAKKGELKHVLDDKNPAQRVEEAGYRYSHVGENIAYSTELEPKGIFQGWMESPHHKENILTDQYQEIGVGIARSAKGNFYFTQVFGTQLQESESR